MSKRPSTATGVISRLRRPAGRLRDLPIWSKLGLIMIVPTLATVVVGANGLIGHIQTANNADRARTLANLSEVAGVLVHELQDERAQAAMLLASPDKAARGKILAAYKDSQERVDAARRPYAQHRTTLAGLPPKFRSLLNDIDASLSDLPAMRSQVVNRELRLSDAANLYQALITDLVGIRESAAQLAGETTLSDRMRAAAAVSLVKDYVSQERVVVHEAFSLNRMTPELKRMYIATRTGQEQALKTFRTAATPTEDQAYRDIVSGSVLREANAYEGYINKKPDEPMDTAGAPFGEAKWDKAIAGESDLIRKVEAQLDREMVTEATDLRDAVQQRVLIEVGLLLGMLLLAILFAWLVARSMARSLRELRHGALSVAQYGLPQAVARLRDPALSTQLSPAQVASQIAEPLPVRSKDEFGQVAEAFNAVHLEAVRTAAEQAALRSSVATMFVNLARRSQILVDRLIGHMDRLERGEEDPDRLAELFQLDHLATRMRRNDENLLVLAGADSTRVQREPAALIDVLRAAQSEVEHYTRIEFGVVDRDIEVAAHAVNDLVHLVAELLDNATAFSPPDSHVVVEARRVGERAVLYVEDRGIGVSPDQLADLNERLVTPPLVDVTVSRMMGLVVVARLAARHGVRVELRPAAERGTIADVTLPTSVLVPRTLAGRVEAPVSGSVEAGPTRRQPNVPRQRSFGEPLALESGPSAGSRPVEYDPLGDGHQVGQAPTVNGGGLLGAAGTSRAMPAWSDLTGAEPGGDLFSPRPPNGRPVEPLPQRRSGDRWTVEGEVTGSGPPSPPQATPGAHPGGRTGRRATDGAPSGAVPPPEPFSADRPAAPPVVSSPPAAYARPAQPTPPVASAPPAPADSPPAPGVVSAPAAPPAWPPVTTERERDSGGTPPVPEKLAAALDMTAEIPKVDSDQHELDDEVPAVRPTPQPYVPPPAPDRMPHADETMELPIFRELESAWFHTRRSAVPESAAAPSVLADQAHPVPPAHRDAPADIPVHAGSQPPQSVATATTGSAGMAKTPSQAQARGAAQTAQASPWPMEPEEPAWHTAADDGWRAATAAAEMAPAGTTDAGLPKRTPMAQLVPGGVDRGTTTTQRRTPEGVRGLLSAYHRGVQRGRSQSKDDDSSDPAQTLAGQQSVQAGKEHEA